MTDREDITPTRDWLKRVVEDYLGIPTERLRQTTALADLGIDSLAQLQLVLLAERELGVKIPDSALGEANLRSLETMAATIDRHRR